MGEYTINKTYNKQTYLHTLIFFTSHRYIMSYQPTMQKKIFNLEVEF